MPAANYLKKVDLTPSGQLQTLVENRRVFNLKNCELNIFESYQQTTSFPLTFDDIVITSMIRGKKVMHLADKPAFDYVPGESVILPPHETMVIDFPEATEEDPTQCIALSVDNFYVTDTIQYLNNNYNSVSDEKHNWQLQFNQYHFSNDNEITDLINKIIRVCSSGDRSKNIFADLNLKELLIRLLQSQHLQQVDSEAASSANLTRFHFIIQYIREHLSEKILIEQLCRKVYLSRNMFFKWFREQSGISPVEYINAERIRLAKQLLSDKNNNLQSISSFCGFSDVNYFIRVFKKCEGLTPAAYQHMYIH